MTNAIRLVIECSVPAGKSGDVKKLLQNAIDICEEKDMGLLSYEFFFNKDESRLYAVEWYKDSWAVLAHLGIVGDALNQLLEAAPMSRAEVFGNASAELIEAFAPFKAKFYKHWGGFTR